MNVDVVMKEVADHLGSDGLDRVEECLRILAGEKAPNYLHDEQEANRLFVPGISAKPWHDTEGLAWVAEMESAFPRIREEFLALREQRVAFAPYEDPYTKELGWQGWDTFSLYRDGVFSDEARARCPATLEALGRTPHGPRDGMFTILNPGVHITPHAGGSNLMLTCHLALIVPPDCHITVAGDTRTWTEGRCLLFDDSFIHEAVNRSDRQRAVLLWDIWHPELTEKEIAAVGYLMPKLKQYLTAV